MRQGEIEMGKRTESFNFEFCKQLAIFTLKKDFSFTDEALDAFSAAFEDHVDNVAAAMLEHIKQNQHEFASSRFNKYIQN